jgi:hypothetical protein
MSILTGDKSGYSSRGFCEILAEDKIATIPEHSIDILVSASSANH